MTRDLLLVTAQVLAWQEGLRLRNHWTPAPTWLAGRSGPGLGQPLGNHMYLTLFHHPQSGKVESATEKGKVQEPFPGSRPGGALRAFQ